MRNITNNIWALLITGAVGVIAAYVLYAVTRKSVGAAFDLKAGQGDVAVRRGLVLVAIIIVVAALLLWRWPGFTVHSHNAAAVLMFVFLGLAAVQSGRRAHNRRFAHIYWTVAGSMAVTAATILVVASVNKDWKHAVLVLEAAEIGVFVFYWSVQTRDNWSERVPSAA